MAKVYGSAAAVADAVGEVFGDDLAAAVAADQRASLVDNLVYTSSLTGDAGARQAARTAVRDLATAQGCPSSSIQGYYEAMGRGEIRGISVPAINIRTLTYDVAQAIFQVLQKLDGGPVLFEIARSEIGYTMQRPAEYVTSILGAALRSGWQGPVMVQGDHFQINAAKFAADRDAEVGAVKELISEAVAAGFYNIDIDTSTLVDLSFDTLEEQQRLNYEIGAELALHLRSVEPEGGTVSVGGEIGEVGKKNSTPEELRAYMDGLNAALGDTKGLSKISVQTGTSHGGVPLADGSVAKVALDFDVLRELGEVSRNEYGMCGAVQHGASTLPDEVFHRFVEAGTAEVHLATGFQNIIYDSEAFPADLKQKIYAWLTENCASERKEGQTDAQFYYKTRKKGFGPFKQELWNMESSCKNAILAELADKFEYLFHQLGVPGSRGGLRKYVG